jgi:hypothetical protein
MPRHIVCLTFDHDHLSGFIEPGLTMPTALLSGEYDGVVIPRPIALFDRCCSLTLPSQSSHFALATAHSSELQVNAWRGLR